MVRILKIFILLLAILLVTISCEDTISSNDDFNGNIIGQVYDFETELVLENANVQIIPTIETNVSADNGTFYFYNIPVGEYTINVKKFGYRDYSSKVVVTKNRKLNIFIPLKKVGLYE